ncbi:MAG: hypothetical protein QNJ91_01785 [Gammaproteobacteria bacterium]|nr:hypothetical protein [Gammaproteobacteria bacterium]
MDADREPITESTASRAWRVFVYVLAVVLVALGLWALGGAIYAAWGLFHDPDGIAYFARYFLETTKIGQLLPGGEGLSHYVAWVAVILLLLVLGKLGAWALDAGARLINAARRG